MRYTDSIGANGTAASAVHSEDWRGKAEATYGGFLRAMVTVADAERNVVALGAGVETADMRFILTESQTALHTAIRLSNGAPRDRRSKGP